MQTDEAGHFHPAPPGALRQRRDHCHERSSAQPPKVQSDGGGDLPHARTKRPSRFIAASCASCTRGIPRAARLALLLAVSLVILAGFDKLSYGPTTRTAPSLLAGDGAKGSDGVYVDPTGSFLLRCTCSNQNATAVSLIYDGGRRETIQVVCSDHELRSGHSAASAVGGENDDGKLQPQRKASSRETLVGWYLRFGPFGIVLGGGDGVLIQHLYADTSGISDLREVRYDETLCRASTGEVGTTVEAASPSGATTATDTVLTAAAMNLSAYDSVLAGIAAHFNELVDRTVQRTDRQRNSVAYFKTHKTGSSTTGSIFYRYAMRHGRTYLRGEHYLKCCDATPELRSQNANVVTHHVAGALKEGPWSTVRAFYDDLVGKDAAHLTSIREPSDLLCSSFRYWPVKGRWPDHQLGLQAFCEKNEEKKETWCRNRWLEDFSYNLPVDANATEEFVCSVIREDGHLAFDWIGVLDRWAESMILLKNVMGWDTVDVLSMQLNSNPRPPGKECTAEEKFLSLDRTAYAATVRRLDEGRGRIPDFASQLEEFQEMTTLLVAFCDQRPRSEVCVWYNLEDNQYEKKVNGAPNFAA